MSDRIEFPSIADIQTAQRVCLSISRILHDTLPWWKRWYHMGDTLEEVAAKLGNMAVLVAGFQKDNSEKEAAPAPDCAGRHACDKGRE